MNKETLILTTWSYEISNRQKKEYVYILGAEPKLEISQYNNKQLYCKKKKKKSHKKIEDRHKTVNLLNLATPPLSLSNLRNDLHAFKINFGHFIPFLLNSSLKLIFGWEVAFVLFSKMPHIV